MAGRVSQLEAKEAASRSRIESLTEVSRTALAAKRKAEEGEKAAMEEVEKGRAALLLAESKAKEEKDRLEKELAASRAVIEDFKAAVSSMLDLGLAYGRRVFAACQAIHPDLSPAVLASAKYPELGEPLPELGGGRDPSEETLQEESLLAEGEAEVEKAAEVVSPVDESAPTGESTPAGGSVPTGGSTPTV